VLKEEKKMKSGIQVHASHEMGGDGSSMARSNDELQYREKLGSFLYFIFLRLNGLCEQIKT
jgi:hypothetical protein